MRLWSAWCAKSAWCAVLSLAIGPWSGAAFAQSFPNRPIRLVGPNNPGSVIDTRARQIADRLGPLLGQPVVVESRPGAAGAIATEYVARAPADGHTLLINNLVYMCWTPHQVKMSVDPVKSLVAIVQTSASPHVFLTHSRAPYNSVAEVMAWAKANPGKLNWGGVSGAASGLYSSILRREFAVDINFVPYKATGGQIVTDLVANVIDVMLETSGNALPLIASGRVKALAVTDNKRLFALPQVPTFAESGYLAGYEYAIWSGLFAPLGTPQEVVKRIATEMVKVIALPDFRQVIEMEGGVAGGPVAEQFAAAVRADYERWGKAIRATGIRPE